MQLADLYIENFRGIKNLSVTLDALTVFIGENNTGKSTILDAIKIALTPGLGSRRGKQFTEYDFYLANGQACPQDCGTIVIRLRFAERKAGEWPEEITQQLGDVLQPDLSSGIQSVILQVLGNYNQDLGVIETTYDFLNQKNLPLTLRTTPPLALLHRFVPLFFLSAMRNASEEFSKRGQFWNSFLKTLQLPAEDRKKLEEDLNKINNDIINSNIGLSQVKEHLLKASQFVTLGGSDTVVLEAFPTRIFDMAGKIQVHLKSSLGATLPLARHGEGTQSLAVLFLFQAFAATNLAEAYSPHSTPVLALEEPEAHLHPSAIRSFGEFFAEMPGQILITSHSGDLLSRVSAKSLRRLYKAGAGTKLGQIELAPDGTRDDALRVDSLLLLPDDLRSIDYNIRLTRGAYLFARCWLLVEGETEFHLLPLIGDLLGISQDTVNYSMLEYSQAKTGSRAFIKLAKSLGIEWFLLADGDGEGNKYKDSAKNYLGTGENEGDRILQTASKDIEHEFWNNGFSDFITNLVSSQLQDEVRKEANGDADKLSSLMVKRAIKLSGGKPAFSLLLFDEIKRRGKESVPQSIVTVLTKTEELARG